MKRTANKSITKPEMRRRTGIVENTGFLLGSNYRLDGWMNVPLPYKSDYENMTVPQIAGRAMRDLEELVARVWPTHQKDLVKNYMPHKIRWLEMAADPLPAQAANDAKIAANNLSFIIKHGATFLEYLFIKRNLLMREVAEKVICGR